MLVRQVCGVLICPECRLRGRNGTEGMAGSENGNRADTRIQVRYS